VIFVDTSAIYALLDARDPNHPIANDALRRHIEATDFVTHSYVMVEALALTQRRLGIRAVRDVVERVQPLLDVTWVDEPRHRRALTRLLAARGRRVSLVDQVSFDLMHDAGIGIAFAFDRDFAREGFALLD
jgi:predicted nucleic acid-binding protein